MLASPITHSETVFLTWTDLMFRKSFPLLARAYRLACGHEFTRPEDAADRSGSQNETERIAKEARFLVIQLHLQAVKMLVLPLARELLNPETALARRLDLVTGNGTPRIAAMRLQNYFCLGIAPTTGSDVIYFNSCLWRLLRERMFLLPAITQIFPEDSGVNNPRERQVKLLSHLAREALFWASRGRECLDRLAAELEPLVLAPPATAARSVQSQLTVQRHWQFLEARLDALETSPAVGQTQACLSHLMRKLRQDLAFGGSGEVIEGNTAALARLSQRSIATLTAAHTRPVQRLFPFHSPDLALALDQVKQVIDYIYRDETVTDSRQRLPRQAFSRRLLLVFAFVRYTHCREWVTQVAPIKTARNPRGIPKGEHYRRRRQEAVDCLARLVAWDDDPATGNALRWLSRVRHRESLWGVEFIKKLMAYLRLGFTAPESVSGARALPEDDMAQFLELFRELAEECEPLGGLYARYAPDLPGLFGGDRAALQGFLDALWGAIQAGIRALKQEYDADQDLFLDEDRTTLDRIRAHEELRRAMVIFTPVLQAKSSSRKSREEGATLHKRLFAFFTRPWAKHRERGHSGWTVTEWRYVADRLGTDADESSAMLSHYRDIHRRLAPYTLTDAALCQALAQLGQVPLPADCCTHRLETR